MYTDHHIREILNLFSNKWTLEVFMLFDGLEDTIRYTEIHKRIPDISDKMLNQTLAHLQLHYGLLGYKRVKDAVPQISKYWLNDKGRELMDILKEMLAWDAKYKKLEEEQLKNM